MKSTFEPLFKADNDYQNNAILQPPILVNIRGTSFYHCEDMSRFYRTGYKQAADKLVEDVRSISIDSVVYPIVFLYRHHVEISLKAIIEDGYFLLYGENKNHKGHHLIELWATAKTIAKEIWNEEFPETDFEFIDHIVQEFDKYDKPSTIFRYAKMIDGKNSNPDLSYINVRHLRDMIEKFNEVLSPIDCRISFYLDHVEEFRFRKSNGTL